MHVMSVLVFLLTVELITAIQQPLTAPTPLAVSNAHADLDWPLMESHVPVCLL